MTNFVVGVRLTADGRSLRGEVDLSEKEFEQFTQAVSGSNTELQEHARKADQAERGQRKIHDSARLATRAIGAAQAAIAGFISFQTIRGLAQLSDEWTNLTTRVRQATRDTGGFGVAMQELERISIATQTTLESNVQLFQGMARVREDLGATNREALTVTETLAALGRIGGSSAEQMSNGMLQFQQAMAGGIVRAEEFNSLLDNIPEVAQAIADGMDMTTGQLRRAVVEGEILSRDVFGVLLRQAPEIQSRMESIPATLESATTNLRTAMTGFIGRLNEALGISRAIATVLNRMAEGIVVTPEMEQMGDAFEYARERLEQLTRQGQEGTEKFRDLEEMARQASIRFTEMANREAAQLNRRLGETAAVTEEATDEFDELEDQLATARSQAAAARAELENLLNTEQQSFEAMNAHVQAYQRYNAEVEKASEGQQKLAISTQSQTRATQQQTSAFSTLLSVIGGLGVSVPVGAGSINLSSLSQLAPLFSGGSLGALGQIGLGAGLGGGLAGGSQNALLGAGLGAAGGFFGAQALAPLLTVALGSLGPPGWAIGAAGAALGGLGGGFLGGLFDSQDQVPRIAVEGRPAGAFGALRGPIGQRSSIATGAFGTVRVGGEDGQGRTPAMQELANRLVALDNMIAERMDPSRVGTAAARANAAVLQSTRAGRFSPEQTAFDRVNAAISAAGNELERIWERIEDLDSTNFEDALEATFQLFDFMAEDVPTTFADMQQAIEQANESLYQSSLRTGQQLLVMAQNFDGTTQSAQELAQATAQRQQQEAALLAQIEQIRTAGQAGTNSLREQIRREFETSTQTANRLVGQSQADLDLLRTLEDPAQIAQVSGRIERNLGSAFGLMSPEQREAQQQFFNDMLDTLDEVREGQLDVATTMIERQGAVIRDAITEALAEPSTNINTAATALARASATLQLAANRIPEEINVIVEPA